MNKTIVLIGIALVGGYWLGNSKEPQKSAAPTYNPIYFPTPAATSPDDEELERRLDFARSNLEEALVNAQSAEFKARMRWVESGSFEDMRAMHDAGETTQRLQSALDDLN